MLHIFAQIAINFERKQQNGTRKLIFSYWYGIWNKHKLATIYCTIVYLFHRRFKQTVKKAPDISAKAFFD